MDKLTEMLMITTTAVLIATTTTTKSLTSTSATPLSFNEMDFNLEGDNLTLGDDDGLILPPSPSDVIIENQTFIENSTQSDIINNEIVQATFCVLYTIIFVLGVVGNVLVCYVVFRNRAMQTVTNFFITNLALSDILLCILAVPFTPLYTFLRRWIFGVVLCHLVPYAQGCSVYISTLTLTSVAIDRFFVILYPFQPRMKLSVCMSIIVSIWAFALLVTLPYGMYVKILPSIQMDTVVYYCEEDWPSERYRKVFGSLTSLLQFALPFLIITFCYVCVSVKLNDRAKAKPGSKTSKREEADRDRKKRTNRMLIAMVAVFGISWLPLNVVNILNDFYNKTDEWKFTTLMFFISHFIAMSSTCYNPFLYAWLNENFRKEFKQILPCFFGASASNSGAGITGRPSCTNADLPKSRKWRSDHSCNGNNDSMVQDNLISKTAPKPKNHKLSLCNTTITRDPNTDCVKLSTTCISQTFPSSSSSASPPPLPPATASTTSPSLVMAPLSATAKMTTTTILMPTTSKQSTSDETILLPSGVLETHFEETINPTSNLINDNKTQLMATAMANGEVSLEKANSSLING